MGLKKYIFTRLYKKLHHYIIFITLVIVVYVKEFPNILWEEIIMNNLRLTEMVLADDISEGIRQQKYKYF